MLRFLIPLFILVYFGCSQDKSNTSSDISDVTPLSIDWSIDSISVDPKDMTYASFSIINKSESDLEAGEWSIHYNQIGGRPYEDLIPANAEFNNPSGDYLILNINEELLMGASITVNYGIDGIIDKLSEAPKGVFAVIKRKPSDTLPLKLKGFDITTLSAINPASPASRYKEYKQLSELDKSQLLSFIPSPQSIKQVGGISSLSETISFEVPTSMKGITKTIGNHQQWLNAKFKEVNNDADVLITVSPEQNIPAEGYTLNIRDGKIEVIGKDDQGAFYGMQSVLQLLYHSQNRNGEFEISNVDITDYPRFGYRGFHLDVSRNFHSVDAVKKILDMMAFFKLNKFHFHITDDEGWRLEIPGLPELTTVGAHRGYTEDEYEHLNPSYGSGPDPNNSYGSGFYTIEEFKGILIYASERNIEVIPEIDLPGHARAAIKAMEARYRRYMAEGNSLEANKYLLSDADDESKYGSAQGYDDNVICVCQEGAFNFVEHVLTSIIEMYQDVSAEMNYLHIGGDEIPSGSWEGSPVCKKFIADMDHVASIPELPANFISAMRAILNRYDVEIAGWEEIMLIHSSAGHNTIEINKKSIDGKTLPYVWNAVWGWGREDMIYKLANAGSPVVMANSAAFYFDMAYDKGPDEIGLSWSGFANTKTAYGLDPLDMFKNARLDVRGQPLDPEKIASQTRLTKEGAKRFQGIQAQLWSETAIAEKWLDYLMYPKMFGFAERAWSKEGAWMKHETPSKVDEVFEQNWNIFANTIGQKGLPMLDKMYGGIGYRKPRVGASESGKENIQFPGYASKSNSN